MNPTETALIVVFAGLSTAIAVGAVEVPPAILHSSVSQAFLLVMTLVLFAYSPVVGIAAIALFAIMMFKRNVQKMTQYAHAAPVIIQDAGYLQQREEAQAEIRGTSYTSTPREYNMITAPKATMVPSNFYQSPSPSFPQPSASNPSVSNTMDGFASPDQVGTYPLGDPRPMANASQNFTAFYRPAEDMGDNMFVRQGPNLDEKMHSFAY